MKRSLHILLIGMLLASAAGASGRRLPADMTEARAFCDSLGTTGPEGIWMYPADDVSVIILRDDEAGMSYGIYVVETFDCALNAGDRLGTLQRSPDPAKFRLSMFSRVGKGRLKAPQTALATYNAKKQSMEIETPRLKMRFRPGRLLPYFWRCFSFSIVNPLTGLPRGMMRIYPSYDGNDSRPYEPRIL